MAAKAKTLKSKIKVEEILEEPVETKIPDEIPTEDETPIPPKVTSFSQLDAMKAAETKIPESPETRKESSILTPPTLPENKEKDVNENAPMVETTSPDPKSELSSEDVKEWLRDVRPDTTKEVEKGRKPNLKAIVLVVLVFLVLGALAGGVYYYKMSFNQAEVVKPQNDVASDQLTPSPTSTPETDLKSLFVSVLNGSGVKGGAAKVKTQLVEAGFGEDKIETGNADNANYKSTSVSLKNNLTANVYKTIEGALGESYSLEKSEENLENESSFDLIIIVGAKK